MIVRFSGAHASRAWFVVAGKFSLLLAVAMIAHFVLRIRL
jgi:hypothetical protein